MGMTLKAARINCGLTQIEAAKEIGVSKATLSNWERGICFPNANCIKRIEEVYQTQYDNLIFLHNKNALSVKREERR